MTVVIVKGRDGMEHDSRARMIGSAAALIGTQGVNATSFSDVLAASGAPRGSIYHHFPQGKLQLAEDAIRWTSGRVLAHQAGYTGTTAKGVLERFINMWRNVVLASNGAAGCVVAGVAIDTNTATAEAELVGVVRSTFRDWRTLIATQLEAAGVQPDRAAAIAMVTLAGMEGALIICRAEASVAPLDTVAAELFRLLPEA